MAAALTITPTSGNVVATKSACRIDATGLDVVDTATYDETPGTSVYDLVNTPTMLAIKYRIKATKSGQSDLVSPEFTPNADGDYSWLNLIFPAAGTWTVAVEKTADDSSVVSTSVVVS